MALSSAHDILGTVFKQASAVFMARIADEKEMVLVSSQIASIRYSVYELDAQRPDFRAVVSGHASNMVDISSTFFDTLQTDGAWKSDAVGYNFRHTLPTSESEPFSAAGRNYLVEYQIRSQMGILFMVRFRVNAI
ncbi:MAG: hypothetical protein PHE53_02400 [Thermoguttaceae bacterium]|nr:hypothetical protein [Thermoguttaceae bacterium]